MRHIIPISGKDSLCTAIVQNARQPDLPYEYLFCDVEMELPETYAWLEAIEQKMRWKITRVGRSLEKIILRYGLLPNHHKRFCTREAKIFPMHDFIGSDPSVVYFGIRVDEKSRTQTLVMLPNVTSSFPLVEAKIDLQAVWGILDRGNILPPSFFWKTLYDMVLSICSGKMFNRLENLKPWEKATLFSWRSRSNCFNCFYQRQYEWVGLLEHHPDLFLRAEKLEQEYGGVGVLGRIKPFWIHEDYPLGWLRDNKLNIIKNRAKAVWRYLANVSPANDPDMLTTVGCGLLCGK